MTFYHLIMHTGCNLSCKYCDRDEFVPFDDTYELCMPDKPEYSLEDLKKITGFNLVHTRFRTNIIIEDCEPWNELNWVGKKIIINQNNL